MEYQIISNVEEKMSLFIEDDMTVGEVRAIIGAMLEVPEHTEMTMTYNGKLLRADEDSWGDVAPRSSATSSLAVPRKLYCNVTGRQKREDPSSEALRAVIPGREQTLQEERAERAKARAMEPMIEAMANNPAMMSAMIVSQPGLKKMMESNPQAARELKDPETLKNLMMSQLDPDRRREMGRNVELALSHISNYPGGQEKFERYMHGLLRDQETMEEPSEADLHMADADLAKPDPSKSSNSDALPNPWQQQPQQQQQQQQQQPRAFGSSNSNFAALLGNASPFSQLAGQPSWPRGVQAGESGDTPFEYSPAMREQAVMRRMYGMSEPASAASAASPSTTAAPAEDATTTTTAAPRDYTAQLETLRAMGFEDESLCKQALEACNGDVEDAVGYLAERMEE